MIHFVELVFDKLLTNDFKEYLKSNINRYLDYKLQFPFTLKVLPQRIKHIRSVPGVPEIFYDPTGKEPCPRPLGEDHGMVVFDYMPTSPVNYFR